MKQAAAKDDEVERGDAQHGQQVDGLHRQTDETG
jgi:hypothetical protein